MTTTADRVVSTSYGRLRGAAEEGLTIFRGVPYAAPPAGQRRFRPPARHASWDGERPALEFSHAAPQLVPPTGPNVQGGGEPQSEDCLYLNVWSPGLDNARRPVVVWLHGGSFVTGSGAAPRLQGAGLARRGDVVYVSLNYRLGALGFLYDEALADGEGGAPGNLGVLDQLHALDWVRDEIANFGGDPDNVTLAGQSAGGMSVGTLLGSPLSQGLFHRAAAHSGHAHTVYSTVEAEHVTQVFKRHLGLTSPRADDLRALPLERLLDAQRATLAELTPTAPDLPVVFRPVVDGRLLEHPPIEAIRAGSAKAIPLIVSITANELSVLTFNEGVDASDEELANQLAGRLVPPDHATATEIIAAYRADRSQRGASVDGPHLLDAVSSDLGFRLPADRLAAAQSTHQPDTYAFIAAWASPDDRGPFGAPHGTDVPFVLGTLAAAPEIVGEDDRAEALAERAQDGWAAFARTGSPDTRAMPWPAYAAEAPLALVFDQSPRVEPLVSESVRELWTARVR